MKKPKKPLPTRRAQLFAEAVTVLCPTCGEVQPAYGGSEFWTHEDFTRSSGTKPCVSCEVPLIIEADIKVQFNMS